MSEAPEITASISYYRKEDDEIIPIECVGHIRPHATYDKDLGYGFDWMRIGDTEFNGVKEVYDGMMGNLYIKTGMILELDVNQPKTLSHDFRVNPDMYKCLEDEYNMSDGRKVFIGKGRDKKRYYVPILSLCKSTTKKTNISLMGREINNSFSFDATREARLELRLTIKKSPKKLYWEIPPYYNRTDIKTKKRLIEIDCADLPTGVGKHTIQFKVRCNTDIFKTTDIKLMAEGYTGKPQMVGAFRIWKNIIKVPKIVLVNVVSDLGKGSKEYGKLKLNAFSESIKKYLLPALVCPIIEMKNLDMIPGFPFKKGLKDFTSRDDKFNLCVENLHPNRKVTIDQIYSRLNNEFNSKYKGYEKDCIKIFYVNEKSVRYQYNRLKKDYEYKDFYAASLRWADLILYTNNSDDSDTVSAHEIYHALGLIHSFNNYENAPVNVGDSFAGNGKYTYDSFETDNIMDYLRMDQLGKKNLFNTWHWQWRIVNP